MNPTQYVLTLTHDEGEKTVLGVFNTRQKALDSGDLVVRVIGEDRRCDLSIDDFELDILYYELNSLA